MCKLTIYRNILALKIFVLLALLIEDVIQIISIKDHPFGFRLIVLLLFYPGINSDNIGCINNWQLFR